jgi:hypothetical protein
VQTFDQKRKSFPIPNLILWLNTIQTLPILQFLTIQIYICRFKIIPISPGLKLYLPPLDVGSAGLHGIFARTINPDVALLDVLLGNTLKYKRNISYSSKTWEKVDES